MDETINNSGGTRPYNDGRGRNPNSIEALKPTMIKPGEVRNPTGKNGGVRPYTDAMKWTSMQKMPEHLRLAMNYKFKQHLFVALQQHPKMRLDDAHKIPDLYPRKCTWAQANSIRQHLAAVLEGNISSAIECREAVEGRTTNRVEFVSQNDKLESLLDAFRMAAGIDQITQEATTITVLPTPTDGNTPVIPKPENGENGPDGNT